MFDITVFGAFLGGLVVFLSPCVLPIVPFYLSYMAGIGMAELRDDAALPPGLRLRALGASVMFSAGIITIFVALGAGAFGFSQLFRANVDLFRWIAAGIVFVMALHFLGVFRIGFLDREARGHTVFELLNGPFLDHPAKAQWLIGSIVVRRYLGRRHEIGRAILQAPKRESRRRRNRE